MKNYFIVTSWDTFRELAESDAENWKANGNTANDLTAEDIVNEYPNFAEYSTETENDYNIKAFETEEEAYTFRDESRDESLYSVFSLEEIAQKTLECMED